MVPHNRHVATTITLRVHQNPSTNAQTTFLNGLDTTLLVALETKSVLACCSPSSASRSIVHLPLLEKLPFLVDHEAAIPLIEATCCHLLALNLQFFHIHRSTASLQPSRCIACAAWGGLVHCCGSCRYIVCPKGSRWWRHFCGSFCGLVCRRGRCGPVRCCAGCGLILSCGSGGLLYCCSSSQPVNRGGCRRSIHGSCSHGMIQSCGCCGLIHSRGCCGLIKCCCCREILLSCWCIQRSAIISLLLFLWRARQI
mmetsp:Transcript_32309/g.57164  ORF Transcript_32309/g.57164 Transcript_32309/m.57164 type:complete len:254 (+) Transcript_32309:787-1548(+)